MKRAISILLVIAMLLGLCACGSTGTNNNIISNSAATLTEGKIIIERIIDKGIHIILKTFDESKNIISKTFGRCNGSLTFSMVFDMVKLQNKRRLS